MKLTWLGHSCFLMEQDSYRIVTDPYTGVEGYPPLSVSAHAVYCSHHHFDHDAVGCGGVIEYAMSLGIDAMLAVGMGLPPLTRFNAAGIKVYSERNTPVVGDAVQIFLMGLCPEMRAEDACRH